MPSHPTLLGPPFGASPDNASGTALPSAPDSSRLMPAHRRRLRSLWRSAGWPCHDLLELDLLSAGMLERHHDGQGRETLRVTDRGIALLADTRRANQGQRNPHEALIDPTADWLAREGRWAWRGLALWAPTVGETGEGVDAVRGEMNRTDAQGTEADAMTASRAEPPQAPLFGTPGDGAAQVGTSWSAHASTLATGSRHASSGPSRWVRCMPDLFSIRPSSREVALDPWVHEIKVQRSDLLAELRRPAKGAAYAALAGACTYVLAEGIGEPDEVPQPFGVMLMQAGRLVVVRLPARRAASIALPTWLALARSTPCGLQSMDDEPWQAGLADEAG